MFALGLLAVGEKGEIAAIRDDLNAGGAKSDCRVEDMGLRIGKTVEMLANGGGGGAILLKVDESRIAIARSMAMKIMVRDAAPSRGRQ